MDIIPSKVLSKRRFYCPLREHFRTDLCNAKMFGVTGRKKKTKLPIISTTLRIHFLRQPCDLYLNAVLLRDWETKWNKYLMAEGRQMGKFCRSKAKEVKGYIILAIGTTVVFITHFSNANLFG